MKILVTGGAGFIGSHVVDRLIGAGHDVVVVDNLSTGKEENINSRATFYKSDIRQATLEAIIEQERPAVINHHAAQIAVNVSTKRPVYDAEVNILGSLNLLEASKKYGVRGFIYSSSGGAVYGEPRYLPCDEAHPINPLSPYGVSKHTVEHYLVQSGIPHSILRYANVYGPRQDPRGEAGVVAIFSRAMLHDEPVVINGDGAQERDFVYVEDVATANMLALEVLVHDPTSRIYNVAVGAGTTIHEIFKTLKAITGYRPEPHYGPSLPGEVYKISLDARKITRELGWRPTVDLDHGLRTTVEWFKKCDFDLTK